MSVARLLREVVVVLFLFTRATCGQQSSSERGTTATVFGAGANFEPTRDADDPVQAKYQLEETKPAKRKRGELAIAPIPMINPTIGNGGGAVALYALRLGGSPIPSTFSVGGFGTGNGSWGAGLGAKLSLRNDRYRITFGGGGGDFNYNFYGIGSSAGNAGLAIPLSQKSKAFLIEPKIRVPGHWFLGPRYHIINNNVSLNGDRIKPDGGGSLPYPLPVPLPAQDLKLTTAALGIRAQRDTTTEAFYPRSGSIFDVTADFFNPAFGAQRNYRQFNVIYDKYIGFAKKNVLAVHGIACSSSSDAPFFDVCLLGNSRDLRGYQAGQYRDHRMLAAQFEYRRELFWRLGAAAFAGAGAVAKTFGDLKGSDWVPGGGAGLRFTLAQRNHIDLRADYAWGDSSHAFYVGVGQAF